MKENIATRNNEKDLKAIHICNSLQPPHKPKIAKEYVFANAESQV